MRQFKWLCLIYGYALKISPISPEPYDLFHVGQITFQHQGFKTKSIFVSEHPHELQIGRIICLTEKRWSWIQRQSKLIKNLFMTSEMMMSLMMKKDEWNKVDVMDDLRLTILWLSHSDFMIVFTDTLMWNTQGGTFRDRLVTVWRRMTVYVIIRSADKAAKFVNMSHYILRHEFTAKSLPNVPKPEGYEITESVKSVWFWS